MSERIKRRAKALTACYAVVRMGGGKEAFNEHMERVRELKDNRAELDRYLQRVIDEAKAAEEAGNAD